MKYKNKDVELEFAPLENGKAEYRINLHDFGNLESVINKTVSYSELNYIIEQLNAGKYMITEVRFL